MCEPLFKSRDILYLLVVVGIASETLNDWAGDEAGLEAVQKILDSLDDIHALQDPFVDAEIFHGMLRDNKLHALLQVKIEDDKYSYTVFKLTNELSILCIVESMQTNLD